MTVSREEVNGLGQRIGEVEKLEPQVKRNADDIQHIFSSLSSLPYKILAMISVPTILLIIQFIVNHKGGQ